MGTLLFALVFCTLVGIANFFAYLDTGAWYNLCAVIEMALLLCFGLWAVTWK